MNTIRRVWSLITAMIFCFNMLVPNGLMVKAAQQTSGNSKNYLIVTKDKETVKQLEKTYDKTDEIGENAQGNLVKNHMTSVALTQNEVKKLEKDADILSVEEDAEVTASSEVIPDKDIHEKEENVVEKNESDTEWNMQMIHAKSTEDVTGKDKVKIAVLDSGVDDGNDIDLAYSITLVPGEEEMSPLFMDGTGHGNSVAGLIAAKDNQEGITGIAPDAEIYSIRVLDDENKAPVSRIVEGIYTAIREKVNIINMSFGMDKPSEALEKAIQDAHEAGILLVAAAGNTGDKGVQYPAAFDEVIAVGSVDKEAQVTGSSPKGEEVEIVAPGELVRSTGVLGDERVDSGTSLAAPQVAAVAAKIWSKNIEMPAEFVRQVMAKSANCYGDKDEYGYGLLDASYALKNYSKYKKEYKGDTKTQQVAENERKVVSFEETGCVKGSWSKDDHEGQVAKYSNLYTMKRGARFPDKKSYVDSNGKPIFAQMTINPWWHGHFKENYVSAFRFETEIADSLDTKGKARNINSKSQLSETIQKKIVDSINQIRWDMEFGAGNTLTVEDKRAFVWGMALHNLTDAFAHSTGFKKDGVKYYLSHNSVYHAHDKSKAYGNRFDCATEALRRALVYYRNRVPGPAEVFLTASKTSYGMNTGENESNGFYMINIENYASTESFHISNFFGGVDCGYGELKIKTK